MAEATTNAFRIEFKKYKQRKPVPDFSHVIDFEKPETWKDRVTQSKISPQNIPEQLGLQDPNNWQCYTIQDHPGFKVILNPFTQQGLLHWIKQCIMVYPRKPNICNLDAHMELNSHQDFWELYTKAHSNIDEGGKAKALQTKMDQLRWVTLGYHYNWNTKLYNKQDFTEFPQDLRKLIINIAQVMNYLNFIPEAGIINYYHMDSTLSGHTDHSELDLTAPLFSISFGQTCIFLLGTHSLNDKPTAMYLRNGDVVIMSGDTRLSYHAVPRILHNKDITNITQHVDNKDDNLTFLQRYLSYSRINVNIRQVEGHGKYL